jgi:hypothetical protein
MKTKTNRIRRNAGTSPAPAQAQTILPPAPPAEKFLIPSKLIQDADKALLKMERVGNAAVALVMMNAEVIEESVKAFDSWQSLDAPGFGKGSLELARIMSVRFSAEFSKLSPYLRGLMEKISLPFGQVRELSVNDRGRLMRLLDFESPKQEIEESVGSLSHCLCLQGYVFDAHDRCGASFVCTDLISKLRAAFDDLWKVKCNLTDAFLVVSAPKGMVD